MDRELLKAQIDEIYEQLPGRPAIISLRKAAEVTGRDERTLLKDGTFPLQKRDGRWDVPVVALAKWLLGYR